jgi:hypothetical protein
MSRSDLNPPLLHIILRIALAIRGTSAAIQRYPALQMVCGLTRGAVVTSITTVTGQEWGLLGELSCRDFKRIQVGARFCFSP